MRSIALVLLLASTVASGCVRMSASASAAEGRRLYGENGCASCHGPSGRGDGPVGRTLSPPPRDFKNDESYTNGRDDASIAGTLERGIDRNGAKMPAFAHLSERERRSLALFVISLHDSP